MSCLFPHWQSTATPSSCYIWYYGSTNHAGIKKAASIFLKSRKFITAWFDNKCVAAPCGTAEEDSAMHPISTYNIGEKRRKQTSIFWVLRGGLSPFSPTSGCAFGYNVLTNIDLIVFILTRSHGAHAGGLRGLEPPLTEIA